MVVKFFDAHDLAQARGQSCLRSCNLGARAQPTGRKLELVSVGQTAGLRAEEGAGGYAYSSIIHPDGAMFPYSGVHPRARRCGAVRAAAPEGAVRLGRIFVETIFLVGRGYLLCCGCRYLVPTKSGHSRVILNQNSYAQYPEWVR